MTRRMDIVENRDDISQFMVHLTRDDRKTFPNGGGTAEQNFLTILDEKEIIACRHHCLHGAKVPAAHHSKFRVSCYTATPLSQIHHLTRTIEGRAYQFEPWGFVFNREFMIDKGAEKATYLNGYCVESGRREAYDRIFERAKANDFRGQEWKVLPFVNTLQPRYDFGWEREWRLLGSLSFLYSHLVCAIVPDDVGLEVKKLLARLAIPMFTPEWDIERMMVEAGNQQRRVKRTFVSPKPVVRK